MLLVGHFDTVWPVGQIARMPIAERDGRLFGPGVLDMKAGLSIGILAARVVAGLTAEGARPRLSLLATSDEEVGSATSRAAIERLAREHDAVLVLEPALPGGAVKTARKGVGEFEVIAHGVSSHAGANPGAGASAMHEIARQILAIDALTDPGARRQRQRRRHRRRHALERRRRTGARARGRADRPGGGRGGAWSRRCGRCGRPTPRVRLEVRGGINRPPMERTEGVARLFELARDVAARAGPRPGRGRDGRRVGRELHGRAWRPHS